MDKVEDKRKNEHCKHKCLPKCIPRGCGKCTSMDGEWKVRYKTCSAVRPEEEVKVASPHYPKNCTDTPRPGSAFCEDCGQQLEAMGVPTGLRDFLTYCGCNVDNYTKGKHLFLYTYNKL
jgi:hypothetical protein